MSRGYGAVSLRQCLIIAFLAIASYAFVILPESRGVKAIQEQVKGLYDASNRDERIIAQGFYLGSTQQRAEKDIEHIAGSTKTPLSARLLESLNGESKRLGLRILEVTPDSAMTPAPGRRVHSPLIAERFRIDVQGKFEPILAFLTDLTSDDPLLTVWSISLSATDRGAQRSPDLLATVIASAYQLDSHWKEYLDGSHAAR